MTQTMAAEEPQVQPRAHGDRTLAMMLLASAAVGLLIMARASQVPTVAFGFVALLDAGLGLALLRGIPRARDVVIIRGLLAGMAWVALFMMDQNDAGLVMQILLCGGLFLAASARRLQSRAFAATGMVAAGLFCGLMLAFNPGMFGGTLSANRTEADWISRGTSALEKGDLRSALTNFEQAIRSYPESAGAHNGLGLVYYRLSNGNQALNEFDRARSLASEDAAIASNRGAVLVELGRNQEAMADLDAAKRLNPGGYENYALSGLAHKRLNQYAEAKTDWEAALRLAPQGADTSNISKWLQELP